MVDQQDDDPAVTELIRLLNDVSPLVRREAVSELHYLSPQSKNVISAMGNAINDVDKEVAEGAGIALVGHYGAKCRIVIPSIIKALQHPEITIRRVAAGILSLIGPEARDAVPFLESLEKDPDTLLRLWVSAALQSIKGDAGTDES